MHPFDHNWRLAEPPRQQFCPATALMAGAARRTNGNQEFRTSSLAATMWRSTSCGGLPTASPLAPIRRAVRVFVSVTCRLSACPSPLIGRACCCSMPSSRNIRKRRPGCELVASRARLAWAEDRELSLVEPSTADRVPSLKGTRLDGDHGCGGKGLRTGSVKNRRARTPGPRTSPRFRKAKYGTRIRNMIRKVASTMSRRSPATWVSDSLTIL